MKRKINTKHSYENFGRHPSLITFSINQNMDKQLKPAEEWIYGSLNISGNNSIMNFKNQKAFNGYQKNRIDLYKLFFFNIFILIL